MFQAKIDETIIAIASARGGACRGIVRLSGDSVFQILERLFLPEDRNAFEVSTSPRIHDGTLACSDFNRTGIPCRLYFWPTRASYTRQPMAELHMIGSPPLLDMTIQLACRAGARLAAPGEFTMRAFLAGRVDLPQAEAVLGVIDAGNERQLKTALTQLTGGLSTRLNEVRNELLDLLADIEAGLDFVDEDIEFVSDDQIQLRLGHAADTVRTIVAQMSVRTVRSDVYRVVLVGSPNVGKSSLINALCDNHVSLVANRPGTTRDFVTGRIELNGVPIELVDTAGIATAPESAPVAMSAQEIGAAQAQVADLLLYCLDSSRELTDEERHQLEQQPDSRCLVVVTKDDCPRRAHVDRPTLRTSSKNRTGLEELKREIGRRLLGKTLGDGQAVAETVARSRESLHATLECLEDAIELTRRLEGNELVASELRSALEELGKVVGEIYTDDILDRVFGRFCIGK